MVIQVTGTAEFEDGSRIVNQSEAGNSIHLPGIYVTIDSKTKVDQVLLGAEESQPAKLQTVNGINIRLILRC